VNSSVVALLAEYAGWYRSVLLRREHSAKRKDRSSWKFRPSSCFYSPNVGEEVFSEVRNTRQCQTFAIGVQRVVFETVDAAMRSCSIAFLNYCQ